MPWLHRGALRLFANKGGTQYRNDDLLVLRSGDGGKTWSAPVTLFKGHFWNCHTGMTGCDHHLYWAVDDLSLGEKRGNFKYATTGGDDRRFLMLLYGLDGLNWFQAGCVAQAAKISQSFMHARPVVDGDDLAIIARSSVDAPNQHDADYATFHRVRSFRKLAMKLVPNAEDK